MAKLSTMLLTQFLCLCLCVYSVWTDTLETGSCTFEAGQNVTYWHVLTNKQMSDRETVANGSKLCVRCPNIDYDYSVYTDNDTTDDENVPQEYIQCVDGAFTKHKLVCEIDTKSPSEASPSPNKCKTIENGQITDRGKSFTCNTDYKPAFKNGMDAILYTRYSCTCNQTSGRLQCMGTEVECRPIGCQIPANVQQGMTLYDPRERRTISAANRYEIQHGHFLTFTCEPSDVFYFEPNRRMFDCVKGSWVAKKRTAVETWDFENNGSFPECRKVLCPADYCKFGGHCIRDHECKCPEQTSGKQCQIPLCNPECQNRETCVSPDVCQCSDRFRGKQCEIEKCAALLAPTNGQVSSDSDTAEFTCSASYCLYGSKIRVCNQGQWNGTNTRCLKGTRVCSIHENLVNNDSALSVSSQYFHPSYPTESAMFGADQGRLNSAENGSGASFRAGTWVSAVHDTNQYIQVNFPVPKIISVIATKGRPKSRSPWQFIPQWVTHYRFMYSIDCKNFITYTDTNGSPKMFYGNFDENTVKTNDLPCPVLAKCARVNPVGWHNDISMKFDIIGCDGSSFTDL